MGLFMEKKSFILVGIHLRGVFWGKSLFYEIRHSHDPDMIPMKSV